jgi:hypothetical protein
MTLQVSATAAAATLNAPTSATMSSRCHQRDDCTLQRAPSYSESYPMLGKRMPMKRSTCGHARANVGAESPATSLVLLAWLAHLYCSLNTADLQKPSTHTRVHYFDLTVNKRVEFEKLLVRQSTDRSPWLATGLYLCQLCATQNGV